VWLAFFLYDVLTQFAALARARGRPTFADRCLDRRGSCRQTSSNTPGTAPGTAAPTSTTANRSARSGKAECQIDSLPQSWSVISGAGDPVARARRWAVDRRLVRRAAG
jgi:cyclic beta-1,2-glucan synthetase